MSDQYFILSRRNGRVGRGCWPSVCRARVRRSPRPFLGTCRVGIDSVASNKRFSSTLLCRSNSERHEWETVVCSSLQKCVEAWQFVETLVHSSLGRRWGCQENEEAECEDFGVGGVHVHVFVSRGGCVRRFRVGHREETLGVSLWWIYSSSVFCSLVLDVSSVRELRVQEFTYRDAVCQVFTFVWFQRFVGIWWRSTTSRRRIIGC